MTKLFNIPDRTWVVDSIGMEFFFDHVDGMYSYCLDKNGNLYHLAAWSEVEICETQHEPPTTKTS